MNDIKQYAIDVIRQESLAVAELENQLTDDFGKAVEAIKNCKGKVIVTGMGKSGIIGSKIAATFASTGTPSFFLHPAEAYHGDLGMIEPKDIVLAIANSGQTDEVLKLIPFIKHRGNILIAMTGNPQSLLAKHANFHLNVEVTHEACPLNLAPTSSTTAMLVMGDALAVALINARNFKAEDYAVFHPGGSLGRRLLTKVSDVMSKDVPKLNKNMPLDEVILAISAARLGLATIVENDKLIGIITDGDIRRAMAKYKADFFNVKVGDVMTPKPITVSPNELVKTAEQVMHEYKIHSLVVTDENNYVEGVVEFFNLA